MAVDAGLVAWVTEALETVGSVTMRRMMGGATLYMDGAAFAIVTSDGVLRFKADAENDALWDAAGCERFSYEFANGRIGTMNYRRAPEDLYDDADALREWAAPAIAAGQRAPKKKPKKR
ncbi:TfoX/Sxy family protein [Sphingomonas sp. LM7]|uniref:TfoX/Sxy family protein n=1 Tax=Sphingomonas sp. LM7 TaxID=1938607 RepID=UPI000983B714|nr:TfoX/Sxy family protein [Sphingomonas sp. LM7]AQR74018.1 competence protein TfoX [Sphingomonas sp. LM7]